MPEPKPVAATVLAAEAVEVDAVRLGDRLLVPADRLGPSTGWELKPEGLCRGDVCVPVRDRSTLVSDGDLVDLAAVGETLHVRYVVDAAEGVAAFDRADPAAPARDELEAPDFTLPDLDGTPVSLSDYDGRKKLLLAFASW